MSITQPVCAFVASGVQQSNVQAPYYHLWLPCSTTFFHIISSMAQFFKKKVTEHKMCISSFSTTFV